MIAKIQGVEDGEWILIDNIREFTMTEKDILLESVQTLANYILIHENWPCPSEGRLCKSAWIKFQGDKQSQLILFDGMGFLLNDDGKTIEKL